MQISEVTPEDSEWLRLDAGYKASDFREKVTHNLKSRQPHWAWVFVDVGTWVNLLGVKEEKKTSRTETGDASGRESLRK